MLNRFSRHLSEAHILEETGVSWQVKAILTVTLLGTLFLLWLTATIHVNEAVKASGEFLPIQGVQRVYPPEGGIVTEILAVNGQIVDKGVVLVRLKNAMTDAEAKQAEARLMGLKARAIRQDAFLKGIEPDFSAISEKYSDVVREQRAFLETQNQVRQKSLWVFDTQIQQKRTEIELATQNLRNMEKSVAVNADLMELQENLGKKNLVSRLSQLESKRVYLDSTGKSRTLRVQIQQNQSALEEVLAKRSHYEKELANQANQELGTIRNEIMQVETLLERLRDRRHNLDVLAPIHGRVQDTRVRTVGGVFNSRDVLMEIVPLADDLQLALQITPKDVGFVHPGQSVAIRVSSYDFSRFGGVSGRLVAVSPFTQSNQEGTFSYKGIVKPDQPFIGDPKAGLAILPGMKADADIISGSRSILSYILNPLTRPERTISFWEGLKTIWQTLKSHFSVHS
ncbi:MAG: HlyD family type I secretion periplasmic adaptor subunit [Magnetococcales bacterium]|nr:HlyD family type I secretion periplasmic adaptor subunit [Magnetococcales bacterium]NGZ06884.1 HlyD family type I secretion periplasmic adaptor subunit [Magnetococcales bacterium]